jgi:hypothetical protein
VPEQTPPALPGRLPFARGGNEESSRRHPSLGIFIAEPPVPTRQVLGSRGWVDSKTGGGGSIIRMNNRLACLVVSGFAVLLLCLSSTDLLASDRATSVYSMNGPCGGPGHPCEQDPGGGGGGGGNPCEIASRGGCQFNTCVYYGHECTCSSCIPDPSSSTKCATTTEPACETDNGQFAETNLCHQCGYAW